MLGRIEPLFPKPLYINYIQRNLNENELYVIKEFEKDKMENIGNNGSINKNVLNHNSLFSIKDDIMNHVYYYFYHILHIKAQPYITDSWFTYTDKDQHHHLHNHKNSIVSGVYYIEADPDYDVISFEKDNHTSFDFETILNNTYNINSYSLTVEPKMIILFPSEMYHSVPKKIGLNHRISLPFNVMCKGLVSDRPYSSLKL